MLGHSLLGIGSPYNRPSYLGPLTHSHLGPHSLYLSFLRYRVLLEQEGARHPLLPTDLGS